MFEKIVEVLVSGVIAPIILESWKQRRNRKNSEQTVPFIPVEHMEAEPTVQDRTVAQSSPVSKNPTLQYIPPKHVPSRPEHNASRGDSGWGERIMGILALAGVSVVIAALIAGTLEAMGHEKIEFGSELFLFLIFV